MKIEQVGAGMCQVGDRVQYSSSGLGLPGYHDGLRNRRTDNHRGTIVAVSTEHYEDSCAMVMWDDRRKPHTINKEYIELERERTDLDRLSAAFSEMDILIPVAQQEEARDLKS